MKVFNLIISTPEEVFFDGDVKSIKAKTSFGQFQMLAEHEPYVASLRPCIFTIIEANDGKKEFVISEGFIETKGDSVTLCVNTIEEKNFIDRKRAENALARANDRLMSKDYKTEKIRSKNAFDRAKARLELLNN